MDGSTTGLTRSSTMSSASPQWLPPAAAPADAERLAARVAELEERNAALEAFAHMAAHELMQPLVMTEAYAAGIAEREATRMSEPTRQDLESLERLSRGVRMTVAALLRDALAGREPLRREWVDLRTVVGDCLCMLAPEVQARRARVVVEDMPMVAGDEALLGSLLVNLLANALKHVPRPGAEIRVTSERRDAGWIVAVESPGAPIPEADRRRIFEPWERGRGQRRARGAGLGLAIARLIVERHGGSIGVTSRRGAGNRFWFSLPA